MPADMPLEGGQKPGLFAACSFAIVRHGSFDDTLAQELANELKLHDGEVVIDSYPETRLSLNSVTHVIAPTYDFPDYAPFQDALVPVVKPIWVHHSLAKDKLANPRQYSPDPRLFMSDVVVCIADLPSGDADAIAGGVLAMGGLFSTRLTSQVTHIAALDLDSETCQIALRKKLSAKIVLPHWFDDCLRLGRKIDEVPYALPDPEILKGPLTKPPAAKRNADVEGATHYDPSSSAPAIERPRKVDKVFKTRNVMLANDLGISSYLRGVLVGLIETSGGTVTDSVSKAHMYICKYRDGRDYKYAFRAGKDIGNLAWLYYLIMTNEWTSPLRRLLHFPVSREGLPGFQGLKISLSNYSGEARTYLENLINATGAECTKTLKQDNTHLVTAHIQSEKCAAAKDWGIHIVNHLWIEESYAKWKIQSISDNRYTHFPHRTNLGEVVGQTQLDRTVLELQLSSDDVEMVDAPEPSPMRQTDANVACTAKASPAPRKTKNASTAKAPDHFKTPVASRLAAPGKENVTPSTTGSRKSKEAAAELIHGMTADMALYEKERKRVGGVVYGGRRKSDEDRIQTGRKRSVSEASDEDGTDENEAKRSRKGNAPLAMRLAISGYKKWVGQPKVEDSDRKQLRKLGISVTVDPKSATHVAVPQIVRTKKFVTALAYAPTVISTDFIDACLEADELLDPEEFLLNDKANEKKLGFSLNVSRERAKENRNQLLAGRSIYCMENVHGGFETFKEIVEANGGKCMMWRGRTTTVPSGRADGEGAADDANHDVYLISDEDNQYSKLWTRFKEMVEGGRKNPRIVRTDWLLETAMSQKVLGTSTYEVKAA